MITSELLAAVKGEFPDLTDKTLRDWVKDGFLQPPERVGMGTDGTPNEWAADSVHRIKVLKSVTNKRVDKSRARKALIAAGFYIGAQALRDELIKQVDEVFNAYSCTPEVEECISSPCTMGGVLMDAKLGATIINGLIAPAGMYDKFYAELQRDGEYVNPVYELAEVFSCVDLLDDLDNIPDVILLNAFNNATNLFNMMRPIIGWLVGYNEYPPLHKSCVIAQCIQRRDAPITLEQYEFEYVLRLVCIAGCLIFILRKDEIMVLLPNVLTYLKAHDSALNAPLVREMHDHHVFLTRALLG